MRLVKSCDDCCHHMVTKEGNLVPIKSEKRQKIPGLLQGVGTGGMGENTM